MFSQFGLSQYFQGTSEKLEPPQLPFFENSNLEPPAFLSNNSLQLWLMYINSQGTNDIRRSFLPPQAAENLFFFCVWTLFFAPAPLFSLERESEFCCIYLAEFYYNMAAAGGIFFAFWMRFCIKTRSWVQSGGIFCIKHHQILKIFRLRRAETFLNPGISKISKRSVFHVPKILVFHVPNSVSESAADGHAHLKITFWTTCGLTGVDSFWSIPAWNENP